MEHVLAYWLAPYAIYYERDRRKGDCYGGASCLLLRKGEENGLHGGIFQ